MTPLPSGTVTFLFTDIEGSTRLWERHPEAMRPALAAHDAILREEIARCGGHIFKTVGDGVYAVFVDPLGALEAARGADALVVLTDWPEFTEVDLGELKAALRRPVVVDGRNLWRPEDMAARGFTYLSFGRPDVMAGEVKRP